MKILAISTDRNILHPDSEVRKRMEDYALLVDQLTVVIISKNNFYRTRSVVNDHLTIETMPWLAGLFIIPAGRFDLITAQDPFEQGLLGFIWSRRLKMPLQLQVHTDFLDQYFSGESIKNKIRVRLARWLLPRAQGVRVVSQRIKNSLTGWNLPVEPVVLPVWVDVESIMKAPIKIDLHQQYPQFKKIILIASRLTIEKDISLAIRAFALVAEKIPDAGLVIVGAGPETAKLKALVVELDLGQKVIFAGWSDDLVSYFKTADLFINTSWYEGYGRTIVEALASGCPVLSTDVGIAREVGADIIDRSVESISAAVIAKLSDDSKGELNNAFIMTKADYLAAYRQSWVTLVAANIKRVAD